MDWHPARMRWDDLFADLEGQLAQAEAAELAGEVADRTRREEALLRITDRLTPVVGAELTLECWGAGPVSGTLSDVGPDWLLLAERGRREVLVAQQAVLSVVGATSHSEPTVSQVWRALDLLWALRGLARSRTAVQVVLRDGTSRTGTLDRVGADYAELADHPAGEQRRGAVVRQVVLLPTTAISVVRPL